MVRGWYRAFLACIFALGLSGCANDPKAANETNFIHAIGGSLDKPGASSVCLQNLPQVPGQVSEQYSYGRGNEAAYEPFVRAGLVEEKTSIQTQPATFYFRSVRYKTRRYELSSLGQKAATKQKNYFGGDTTTFCYATFRVGKIVNFTEPGDVMDMHVTQVRWLPKIVAVADWVKDQKVVSALPSLSTELTTLTSQEKNSMLDLTNAGWEVAR